MFVVSYSCVDFFFFFLRQTTLCMVCLKSPCVFILGGGLGFLGWGGFFVALKKKSGFAVMFKFMYSFMMHYFHFNACMTIFSFLIHTWAHHFWVFCDGCFFFWLFLLGLVHSLPPFLPNFAWSWLLLPLSQ